MTSLIDNIHPYLLHQHVVFRVVTIRLASIARLTTQEEFQVNSQWARVTQYQETVKPFRLSTVHYIVIVIVILSVTDVHYIY